LAALLGLIPVEIFTPMQIRMVTTADWSNLEIISKTPIRDPRVTGVSGATEAKYENDKLILIQGLEAAQNKAVAEMAVDLKIVNLVNVYALIRNIVLGADLPRVDPPRFQAERGHIGWTYVEVSNTLGDEPLVVGRLWWSDIEEGPQNVKDFEVPGRLLYKEQPQPIPPDEPDTLIGKALLGYQGWFGCEGDGSDRDRWVHWSRDGSKPSAENLVVDFWPDVSEYADDELYETSLHLPDGSPARVFSSYDEDTVNRHFEWMRDYDLDGVFAQRFLVELEDAPNFCFANMVLGNVRRGAEQNGRAFAVMYDVSGALGSNAIIKEDWRFLVEVLKITESPNYLRHNGKPVVGIWGPGFASRYYTTYPQAMDILNWFKADAPANLQATTVGGVPTHWMTLDGDSNTDPHWAEVYRMYDVISPWTVGRYGTLSGVDAHIADHTAPEIAVAASFGAEYMPVVWPGFSWHNLNPYEPSNEIPRNGGAFLSRQATGSVDAGARMLYIAMFDEVDEGTAVFKLAPTQEDVPVEAPVVSLDADGYSLLSDHYLDEARLASEHLRSRVGPAG